MLPQQLLPLRDVCQTQVLHRRLRQVAQQISEDYDYVLSEA